MVFCWGRWFLREALSSTIDYMESIFTYHSGILDGTHLAARLHPLGGCGVSTSASQLTPTRVRNFKSAPISQVGCNRWLGGFFTMQDQPFASAHNILFQKHLHPFPSIFIRSIHICIRPDFFPKSRSSYIIVED